MNRFLPLVFLTALTGAASISAAPAGPPRETAAVQIREVSGDPLFFVKPEDGPAVARLLHVPETAPVLRSATLEMTYQAGRDFEWTPGTRDIVLTAGTRIPFKTTAGIHPPAGSPHSYRSLRGSDAWMLFDAGRYIHDLQSVASYPTRDTWTPPAVSAAPDRQLGRVRARLKAAQPVKLVTLGDSISTGLNASGVVGAPPGQPGYPGLVAQGLERRFGSRITAKNLSVSGMDAAWGLQQVPAVIAEKPDLVLLAFGMNDASGHRSQEEFSRLIEETKAGIQAAVPACDVILVAPMTANTEWIHAAPELYPVYAGALQQLAGPGCACAGVTAVWLAVAERKTYLSLSGNGLNHPNDFGHRLYADVVLAVIGEK